MHNLNCNCIPRCTLRLPSQPVLACSLLISLANPCGVFTLSTTNSAFFSRKNLLPLCCVHCLIGHDSFFPGTRVYVLGVVAAPAPVLYASWDVTSWMLELVSGHLSGHSVPLCEGGLRLLNQCLQDWYTDVPINFLFVSR